MDHDSRDPQPSSSSSIHSSSTARPSFNVQDLEWGYYFSSAPPTSAPPEGYVPDLSYLNEPWPKPASESPITLDDAIRKINHHILRSCAALALDGPEEALAEANFALYLAEARKVYHLQSKSQFYCGLCLMELERWQEASNAFTRAANVRGWAWKVAELKKEAMRRMRDAEERRKRMGKEVKRWGMMWIGAIDVLKGRSD